MLANIEYKLVRNNYVEMVNKPNLLIYRKKDDPIAQLTIRKDSDSYSLSLYPRVKPSSVVPASQSMGYVATKS